MTRALFAAATCCCALSSVSALAEGCDRRYPGSCRLEVSTTIVKTKGDSTAIPARSPQRMKRARKPLAVGIRVTGIASVPLPAPSPRRIAAFSTFARVPLPTPSPRRLAAFTKPTTIVDEAFNILTLNDSNDAVLEAALSNRRTRFLDSISR
jgi:hypothetical protein